MNIPYRQIDEFIPVDITKLRPKGSYAQLMKNRTHSIDDFIEKNGGIPDEFLKERSCPTCGSRNYSHELSKDYLKIVKCKECSLIFTSPTFDEAHYRETYQSEVYAEYMSKLVHDSHSYRVERFGNERVSIMSTYLDNSDNEIRYLDIGCSSGAVVEAATNKGWAASGIDLNESAIEFGRDRGLNLVNGDVYDQNFEPGSFEVISAFDVLEHVLDPVKMLKKIHELLVPGGIALIFVPNWNSATRVLLGKDAHYIRPTHHLTYYTPLTLEDVVVRNGFKVESILTEGLDISDFIWRKTEVDQINMDSIEEVANELQFFVNAGGWGKNLRTLIRKEK